ALLEEAEQRAVIAAELDDERARRDGMTVDHIVGVGREMLAQAERQRGGVDIVPVLDLRIADMENLEMPALPAEIQFQRDRRAKHRIVGAGMRHLKVRRANRHAGHRYDQLLPVRATEAAGVPEVEQVLHCESVKRCHLLWSRWHRLRPPQEAGYSARPMIRSITAIIQN